MFYSQDILQKRGGKFGIIWIAATKSVQLTRRDYTSVNVRRACEDIIDYILVRIPASRPEGARPRFSLYLSSQLMYGVVRVYSKQHDYFLTDVSSLTSRFHSLMATTSTLKIDIKQPQPRPEVQLGMDLAALATYTGPEYNPEFGVLRSAAEMMDFQLIPDMEILKVAHSPVIEMFHQVSPTLKDISLPPSPQLQVFRPDFGSPHTVPQEQISLREEMPKEEISDIKIPGELELPTLDGTDLESLLSGGEEGGVKPMSAFPSHLSPVREWEEEETRRPVSPQQEEQLTTTSPDKVLEEALGPAEITPAVIEELHSPPRQQPHIVTPGITPVTAEPKRKRKELNLTLELSPLADTPPSSKRRKRQLMFADNETQIPRKQLRDQLAAGTQTCTHFELPVVKQMGVKDLFGKPFREGLRHRKLIGLWSRNATTRMFAGTDSDLEQAVWTVPELGKEELSSSTSKEGSPPEPRIFPLELSPVKEVEDTVMADISELARSIEVPRDASTTLDRSKQLADVSAQISALSESHESLDHSVESRRSSARRKNAKKKDGNISSDLEDMGLGVELEQIVEKALSMEVDQSEVEAVVGEEQPPVPPAPRLSPLLEEAQEPSIVEDRRTVAALSSVTDQDLLRMINTNTRKSKWTDFRTLAPPTSTSRCDAAKLFTSLLVLCSRNVIEVKQEEPYGDIRIARGRNW